MKGQVLEVLSAMFLSIFIISLVYLPLSEDYSQPILNITGDASSNWAGYVIQTTHAHGPVDSVEGSWTVPEVSCPSINDYASAFWIGIDGFVSKTVQQIGTDSDCYLGIPVYYAWYEMYPEDNVVIDMKISPGDEMYAKVEHTGNGMFNMSLFDMTTGKNFSVIASNADAERSSAEWIVEAPMVKNGWIMNLAPFGTASFREAFATINGTRDSISGEWYFTPVIMRSSSIIKASPSILSDGSSFAVEWHHR